MTCGNGVPLAAVVSAGQAHESRHFERVAAEARSRRRRPVRLAGDKGYSYPAVRRWCEREGVRATIPQRSDQVAREGYKIYSPKVYRRRNVVERCINALKENRRVATRYEKLARTYLAMLKLACIRRMLRLIDPSDRP